MKTTITLVFILTFALAGFGQTKESAAYTFAQKDSEFAVLFPGKPDIDASFSRGVLTIAAQLVTPSEVFLRAETTRLSEKLAEKFSKEDDKFIAGFPTAYAANSGLTNSTVQTGRDKFGRYAKLRGYKMVGGNSATYDIYFYVGKTEAITIYAATKSAKYPAPEITKFLESLSFATGEAESGTQLSAKDGDDLNGKARSLPKPAYPPAARAQRASGTVIVEVNIDEEGNVFSAKAVTGHPLLQQAAELAARQAKFRPFYFNGQKLKVTGQVNYNFIP